MATYVYVLDLTSSWHERGSNSRSPCYQANALPLHLSATGFRLHTVIISQSWYYPVNRCMAQQIDYSRHFWLVDKGYFLIPLFLLSEHSLTTSILIAINFDSLMASSNWTRNDGIDIIPTLYVNSKYGLPISVVDSFIYGYLRQHHEI